ncbi:ribosome biogenesis GTP-binding protein YihA/YsxC [Alicyclobacillus contaminans]|uniref:ribosome biogenesis GTP-binding protein YihA/YsxC n=1 Tax=Alicyclobacillus contaminans TaxID=392016 RepID=UPI00047DC774|nr:ribosome biogenesis GTP-binding protein YihA/YsxC [Alicyclobacillus contaminans]
MKLRSAVFEISAVKPEQWPTGGLPEFAFVGRSNVGKSSLLNRLLGRKSLARVSAKPGKTQQINFYRINDLFRFVDLPGYGYAQVSKRERALFVKMMESYLRKRDCLARIIHLIDIRHEPTRTDVEAHRWFLELGVPLCVVATKQDKVSKSAAIQSVARIRKGLDTPYPVISVSSEKNVGLDKLWEILSADLVAAGVETQGEADVRIGNQHTADDEHSTNTLRQR